MRRTTSSLLVTALLLLGLGVAAPGSAEPTESPGSSPDVATEVPSGVATAEPVVPPPTDTPSPSATPTPTGAPTPTSAPTSPLPADDAREPTAGPSGTVSELGQVTIAEVPVVLDASEVGDDEAGVTQLAQDPAVAVQPVEDPVTDGVVADVPVADGAGVVTAALDAAGAQTVALTWDAGADTVVDARVRTQTDGVWSEWAHLEADDVGVDAGTADDRADRRAGTDAFWVGDADAVQLAFAESVAPAGLTLALIGDDAASASGGGGAGTGTATSTAASTDAPAVAPALWTKTSDARVVQASSTVASPVGGVSMITREEWGAAAPACQPDVASRLVGAVLHHTAQPGNDYATVDEAKARLRQIQAYHIAARGWCDICYNMLVDKWGNLYEGRDDSMTEPVIGVHTGGFNTGTFGVSMLGDYSTLTPSAATTATVARAIAARFGAWGLDATGTMAYTTTTGENSRYQNQTVTLPRVFGHRDTAYTACPGNAGYATLAAVRTKVAQLLLPVGYVDAVRTTSSSLTVAGWAMDPMTPDPIAVHVYVDGRGVSNTTAGAARPDVAAVYGNGAQHGFSVTIPASPGTHSVCVFAIGAVGGRNTLVECREITVVNSPPMGALDVVRTTPAGVTVIGWAMDPDTSAPIAVHAYVDGRFAGAWTASDSRPDVGRIFGNGAAHGFTSFVPTGSGEHDVCLYAIDSQGGPNPVLACRRVTVVNATPIGSLDRVTRGRDSVTVAGWAMDPDTAAPIAVHVYVDGQLATGALASRARPDVGRVFGNGSDHGFQVTVPAGPASREVCVYAIDSQGGTNPLLACRRLTGS